MKLILTIAGVASLAAGIGPAMADPPTWAGNHKGDRKEWRDDRRDDRREAKHERKEYRREAREDWRRYQSYDYNRPDPRYRSYNADRYYRDGSYYQPRRLSSNDRVYRGNDGRYYCRRSDGTTGLLIGAGVGGLLGNTIAPGGSKLLGTILGGGVGAALGSSIDRGNVTCR